MGNGNQKMENHQEMKLFPRSLTSSSAQMLCSILSAKLVVSTLLCTHGSNIYSPGSFSLNDSVSIKDKLGLLSQSQNIQETEFKSAGSDVPL